MGLLSFFKKAVDRPIEGVIKADELEELKLKLEVEEYVLTNEVEQKLENFLEAYTNYVGVNGVWISGFFGSGKSHLLKMLALLLENKNVAGLKTSEAFVDKCSADNEFLKARIASATGIPSKSILFNIDQKADVISKTEIDALVAVFVKVFDEACGYYGKQAYIAQFERELDRDGLFDKFKNEFQSASGQTWEFGRERANRYANEIDRAYNNVTGQNAVNILDKHRTDYHLSIEDFANQVKEYIDKQEPNFRLNFFVDEVGQYIANNEKLMVNLQTVAESLATKCKGRSWVIVTAQNDMSKVLGAMENKLNTNDYTKIQDRFKIKLDLTSAAVAEVIQKRLLTKNKEAEKELAVLYKKEVDNFKTLFDFADCQTYKNFQSESHFVDCYPFIPYQFTLFQYAIENLSMHDAFQGKYSSVGERSMLSVFQKVAIKVSKNGTLGELATFDMMFEGIRNSLKTSIQSSILKAEQHLDSEFAVRILKALFLVKYIKGFKSTIRNLCVLMYNNFDENVSDLTKRVEEALNLLEQQTYIQRTADVYEYLTDEEKDVEQEIKNTEIDRDNISAELSKLIFDYIIKNTKIRYGEDGRDYPFSRKLDGKLYSREQELAIHVISPLNGNEGIFKEGNIKMLSIQNDKDLMVALEPDFKLVNDIIIYKKTEKYINENRNMQQQESVKKILNDRATQNIERYNRIQQSIQEAVGKAKFYVNGNEIEIAGDHAQSRIIKAFQELIGRTYTHLNMICGYTYKEDEIATILSSNQKSLFIAEGVLLPEAEQELLGFIQRNTSYRTTVKVILEAFEKIPYGWSYAAILCNIAKLCARRKIEIKEDSNILSDSDIVSALRSTAKQPNLILQPQMDFSPSQVRNLKEFYGDFANEPTSDSDAKTLALSTAELLKNKLQEVEILLAKESEFKFLNILQPIKEKLKSCCGKAYSWYLTDFRSNSDELLELKESIIDPITNFINGVGGEIYRNAVKFLSEQKENFQYIDFADVQEVQSLLGDANCFKGNSIQVLKEKVEALKSAIENKLIEEKEIAEGQLNEVKQLITSMEEYAVLSDDKKARVEEAFNRCEENIKDQKLIVIVKNAVENFKDSDYKTLLANITLWAKPQEEPSVETQAQDDNTPATEESRVVQPIIVVAKGIKTNYSKPLIGSESEVEEYINSLKEAYLQQIKEGKKIQL
jgi:hypothetical protein